MVQRLGRTIFAVLIGLSVALLPATTGFAAGVTPTTESSAVAMPDCDHHHNAPAGQTHKAIHGGACMANCALSCFSFAATGYSAIALSPPVSDTLKPARVSDSISSLMGSPPFRPPRS